MKKSEATKPAPLMLMFENIMCGHGLFTDSTDWRELRYAFHVDWLRPLLDLGCIQETEVKAAWPEGADRGGRPQFSYHHFAVTPFGMEWWAKTRTEQSEAERGIIEASSLCLPRDNGPIPMDGKGIGAELWFSCYPDIQAAVKGIAEGYFELVRLHSGRPGFWRMGESIAVRLTRKGMAYFDSIPRLELECA